MPFEIPIGEARFTAVHPKFGVRVRVRQENVGADLTGEKVAVTSRGGVRHVRLTKRISPATDGKPGLYEFQQGSRGRSS